MIPDEDLGNGRDFEVELTGLGGKQDTEIKDLYEVSEIGGLPCSYQRREYGGENCVGRVRWVKVKKVEVILGHDKFEVNFLKAA